MVALLNGDLSSRFDGSINGGQRRGHIEGNLVGLGKDRYHIGPDLVGHITIGCNTVGSDNNCVHFPMLHEISCRIISDYGYGDTGHLQFPGCEPGALQDWSRLIRKDLNPFSCFYGCPHNTKGSAVAACGQSTGVTVSQDTASILEKLLTVASY